MRTLFIIACFANIAFAFGTLPWMPDPMANHFSLNDGTPGRFESRLVHAIAMCILIGFMTFVFLVIFSPLSRRMESVPNRDYWLREENRPKIIRRFHSYFDTLGFGAMLFILFFQWDIFQANQKVPPQSNPAIVLYGCTILATLIVVETIRLYMAFRLPKGEE